MEKLLTIEKSIKQEVSKQKVLAILLAKRDDIEQAIFNTERPKYLYWSEFKNKNLFPKEFSREEIWAIVKLHRMLVRKPTVIRSESGAYFNWVKLSRYDEIFHNIDLDLGGHSIGLRNISKDDRQIFISRGIMEEAIASSQLDGAQTTRKEAQSLLREARRPTDQSERMIANNYKAMTAIEENFRHEPLSIELLTEIHTIITENTLPKDIKPGCYRKDSDDTIITNTQNPLPPAHRPPKTAFVKKEMRRLIAFANDELDEEYMHPVIKAIMLHFWIGYLQPSSIGNGRLARALFYWYLLKNNYWTFACLPLSSLIKKSTTQYSISYIRSKQNGFDLTYFIDYNLRKIKNSQQEFNEYMQRKSQENRSMAMLSKTDYSLNDRQIKLIQHLSDNFNDRTNIQAHMSIYGVAKRTATEDLKLLVEKDLLTRQKQGRNTFYYPTIKVKELF